MDQNYDSMLQLARSHSFTSFTELQEVAFRTEDTYDYEKDLFIMGETSSGKTLIPMLLYEAALKEAEDREQDLPKMLFIVPYRALAAQKTAEMRDYFKKKNMTIVQSTGEFRQDDDLIQNAEVDIAIVITEKIYKYESRDPYFLSKYDYVVLDEIGLINHSDRGIKLDFIFAWAKNQKLYSDKPRIVALGTPFFDWSAYIDSYGFTAIKLQTRPVKLNEITVYYADNGIERVEGECTFLSRVRKVAKADLEKGIERHGADKYGSSCPHLGEDEICPFSNPCRTDRSLLCSVTQKPCSEPIEIIPHKNKKVFQDVLLKICREHLMKDHQILIFVNDRAKVIKYSSILYNGLKDLLPTAPPAEECKRRLLSDCGLESDDVFGIMEYDASEAEQEDFYQAFMSGIGFHSAALPNELRTYVEHQLLDNKNMRIVCSTETLAYGVNSSVDVVIIADLYKHEGSEVRPLTLNEFQNYSGRAGRLRSGADRSDINGYVYTLVSGKQLPRWNEMIAGKSSPEKLYSMFHLDQGQFMPFFLLNLLPTTGESSMSAQELIKTVQILPQDGSVSDSAMAKKIQDAIKFLEQQGLATKITVSPMRRGACDPGSKSKKYCLTEIGKRLRGYIIGCDDYLNLVRAVEEYVSGVFSEPNAPRFLFNLLCTKHAESGLNSLYTNSQHEKQDAFRYIKLFTPSDDDMRWLRDGKKSVMTILAALLAWCDGESPKHLYRQYGIHYALLNKLAEQIAYLIEIAKEILPLQMERIYRKREDAFAKVGITFEHYTVAVNEKLREIQDLFTSIYYGINTGVIKEISESIRAGAPDSSANGVLEELSLQYINPIIARKLRRIVIRYKFFSNPPKVDLGDVEQRNNYYDQLRQYKRDVESFGKHVSAFFHNKFKNMFED